MSVSKLTKEQWFSVVKNVVFAALAAYVAAISVSGTDQRGAVLVGVMAALKVVEKLLTPAV